MVVKHVKLLTHFLFSKWHACPFKCLQIMHILVIKICIAMIIKYEIIITQLLLIMTQFVKGSLFVSNSLTGTHN